MTGRKLIIGRGAQPPAKKQPAPARLGPFTDVQFEQIRKGKITCCLVSASLSAPRIGTLRPLRKITRVLDGDGKLTGETRVLKMQAPLTIRSVSKKLHLDELNDEQAKACGYATAADLERAWLAVHPRTPLVRLVRFASHDVRDPAPLMRRTAGETLAPSKALDPDAPKIPRADQQRLTELAHARDRRRALDPDIKLHQQLQRALEEWDIERMYSRSDVANNVRAIRQQIRALDRKLKAA